MRYCTACGDPVAANARFCGNCGSVAATTPQPGWHASDGRGSSGDTDSGRHSRRWLAGLIVALLVVAGGGTGGYLLASRHQRPHRLVPAALRRTRAKNGHGEAARATATPAVSSTSGTGSFAAVYRSDASGVVKVVASTCGGTGIGTGFLLPSGLIATVAHVVTGAVSVAVIAHGVTTGATVVGYDATSDLALLRPVHTLAGHAFHFASQEPSVGDPVAAIGYPLDQPETLTAGTVSGLNRKINVDGYTRSGMIETDAPINPGNSGGPLITPGGTVVGLVDALETDANGIGYADDAQQARPELTAWQADPSAVPTTSCSDAAGPSTGAAPSIGAPASGADVAGITSTLSSYFDAINSGDYATACAQQTASLQGDNCLATLTNGDATSYDFNFDLTAITEQSPGVDVADLNFTSIQDSTYGPNGDVCDNWTLAYTMVDSGGSWLINSVVGQNGSTHTSC